METVVRNPRICWFGIYSKAYPRNAILLKGLEALGHTVVECVTNRQGVLKHLAIIRQLRSIRGQYDVIYVAYPAPSVALWARMFGGARVVVDAFYSMYDAVVCDRKEISSLHPRAWKLAILDWISIMVAHHVVADTIEHMNYWKSWWFCSRKSMSVTYIGVDDGFFTPVARTKTPHEPFRILFHGSYIPLHGVECIVEAAHILKDNPRIQFRFVGRGQDFAGAMERIKTLGLNNIEVVGEKVPQREIVRYIGESDIVLGIFGKTMKARRVIPNKVYEALAMRKPVITMDTPAIRELFTERDMVLVQGSGASLASAIVELVEHPERLSGLAEAGYRAISKVFPRPLAQGLMRDIEHVTS